MLNADPLPLALLSQNLSAGQAPASRTQTQSASQASTQKGSNSAGRTTDRDARSQLSTTALAAKIAATVVLSSSTPIMPAIEQLIAAPAISVSTQLANCDQGSIATAVAATNDGVGATVESPILQAVQLPVSVAHGNQAGSSGELADSGRPADAAKVSNASQLAAAIPQAMQVPDLAARPAAVNASAAVSSPDHGAKPVEAASQAKAPAVQAKDTDGTQLSGDPGGKAPDQAAIAGNAFAGALDVAAGIVPGVATALSAAPAVKAFPAAKAAKTVLTQGISDSNPSMTAVAANTKSNELAFGKAADPASAAGAGKASPAASAPAPANAAQQAAANNNQADQHAQGGASQNPSAAAKASESASAQIQFTAPQPAAHESVAVSARTAADGESIRAAGQAMQAQGAEPAATPGINTAKVIQSMSETEMRVGMHSAEFGDISIRTSVSMQQMTAQISVDHSDLGKAISAHIPAMEERLGGEFGLRATVEVNQGAMSFSNERGGSPQQEQRASAPAMRFESVQGSPEQGSPVVRAAAMAADGGRLDVRA